MSAGSYYIPEQSRIPIYMAASLGLMAYGAGLAMIGGTPLILVAGLLCIAIVMYCWFSIIIDENMRGLPDAQVKRSYVMGMSWFIFSEVMFFAAFFGALFYVRVLALPWLDGQGSGADTNTLLWEGFEADWPLMQNPDAKKYVGPSEHMGFPGWDMLFKWLPLWNTLVLLTSSVTCHFAHHALKHDDRSKFNFWLGFTLVLAFIFLALQYEEYHHAYAQMGLTLESGIYGTTFFMLTGFHGFHVAMGTFILLVQFIRSLKGHFKADDHFGFEAASWYWHFVDVVWVGLFICVYILGS